MSELHVIFGTGPLGQSVMRELIKRGKKVRMINRSGKANVPQAVEVVASDAYNPEETRRVTEGASVVYQCAQPGYSEWPEKFMPLQSSILQGVAANGAKFIVGDNLYMYGDVDGNLHEALPYVAHTRKGKVRGEMAQAVLDAHKQGKVRAALVRGSDFYGAAVLGSAIGERVLYPILDGKAAQFIGNPDLPHTYTYIDDFGKAMVIAGERDEALGQAWHVPNAPTTTTREVVNIIAKIAGQEAKISVMPKMMLRILSLFISDLRELNEMMYEFEKPFVVDSSKFESTFGMQATPLEDGLRQTVEWFKANPAK